MLDGDEVMVIGSLVCCRRSNSTRALDTGNPKRTLYIGIPCYATPWESSGRLGVLRKSMEVLSNAFPLIKGGPFEDSLVPV